MKEILTYILGVVVCSALFTVFYRTVLHRRIPFRVARIYLVSSLVAAAVIPALDIPVWRVAPIEITLTPIPLDLTDIPVAMPAPPPVDWARVAVWALWAAGIAVLAVVMSCQIVRIVRIKRRAEVFRATGCEIALSVEISSPFSFLGTVFVERGTSDNEMRQIVLHEASHIRHRHSQEKIAMEAIKNLLWFNPFAWWAASLLGEVHEFEADRDVLDGGFTVEEYLPLIFRQIFGYNPELSVGLGDSLTKKRFLMMKNKMKLTKYSALRVAGVLPLAAGLVMLFSFTSHTPEIIYTEAPVAVETAVQAPVPGAVEAPAAQSPQKPDGDTPVYNAEVMPKFQGGDLNGFRDWVQGHLVYPKEAIEKNISGKVVMRFVIEKDGSVSSIEVISSPSELLAEEAIRVLKSSPKWSPGMQRDKAVRVFYILPVEFGLFSDAKPTPAAQKPQEPQKTEDIPIFNAEVMPKFQGGDLNGFRFWVQERLIYPREAVEKNISGKVTVRFVIERDGTVSNIEKISSPDEMLTGEVVRIMSQSPKWSPGTQGGKPVRVFYIIPIEFMLQHNTEDAAKNDVNTPAIKIRGIGTAGDGEQPLFFFDGKEITAGELEALDPNTIGAISVLKDASAVEAYGERAKVGVVLITSKDGEAGSDIPTDALKGKIEVSGVIGYGTQRKADGNGSAIPFFKTIFDGTDMSTDEDPLLILDGKEITAEEMSAVSPEMIKSISVLKEAAAKSVYGEKGKNGVILITLKSEK